MQLLHTPSVLPLGRICRQLVDLMTRSKVYAVLSPGAANAMSRVIHVACVCCSCRTSRISRLQSILSKFFPWLLGLPSVSLSP